MKKKYSVTYKDKKDWIAFTKRLENVSDKDVDFSVIFGEIIVSR